MLPITSAHIQLAPGLVRNLAHLGYALFSLINTTLHLRFYRRARDGTTPNILRSYGAVQLR
jgi:hypothetical protein